MDDIGYMIHLHILLGVFPGNPQIPLGGDMGYFLGVNMTNVSSQKWVSLTNVGWSNPDY